MVARRVGRRGFTLVELLVVVAVIGLLLGVLLPSLAGARRGAMAAACLNNVRQLSLAQTMYAHAHDGRLIDYGLSHGGAALDAGRSWLAALRPYLADSGVEVDLSPEGAEDRRTPGILRSPVDDSPHWSSLDGGPGIPVPGTTAGFRVSSYGVNEHVGPEDLVDPLGNRRNVSRLDRIPRPTETVQFVVMAFEGEFAGSDHVHTLGWTSSRIEAPVLASRMVEIGAHGGPASDWDARSSYGYVGGNAAVEVFRAVYAGPADNRFDPTAR